MKVALDTSVVFAERIGVDAFLTFNVRDFARFSSRVPILEPPDRAQPPRPVEG